MSQLKKRGIWVLIISLLLSVPYPGWLSSVGIVHAAVSFVVGDGTENDPFQIATAEQLNEIRNYPTSHFLLTHDIDLSEDPSTTIWDPIPSFSGSLDGGGYTISNLKILGDESGVGLFENILAGGRIVNLTIDALEVSGDYDVGILVGHITGSTVIDHVSVSGAVYGWFNVGGLIGRSWNADAQISNVIADVDVIGHFHYTGGLIGLSHGAHISDSQIDGTVTGERMYTGGVIGQAESSTLSNSSSLIHVTGQDEVGGLIGRAIESEVSNMSSSGEIMGRNYIGGLIGHAMMNTKILESSATGRVSGNGVVGGLIGGLRDNGEVSNSSAFGLVEGLANSVGGLIGTTNNSNVSHSTASGTVAGVGNSVGGLIGRTDNSNVSYSTASGTVIGDDDYVGGLIGRTNLGFTSNNSASGSVTSKAGYVGGLIGENRDADVSDSFASGDVKANLRYIGGLIGRNRGGDVANSYAKGTVVGDFGPVAGSYGHVGGLIGRNSDGDEVRDSYATGNVTANSNYIGGLIGYLVGHVTNSYATGNVTANSNYIGGLIGGAEDSSITSNYATGNVIGESSVGGLAGLFYNGELSYSYASGNVQGCEVIGGLVGDNYSGEILNSYAKGNVAGLCSSDPNGNDSIGGLVGDNSGDIVNSYSIGLVMGDKNLGGLVGYDSGEGTITNSYYDKDLSGQSDHKGQGLTSEEMKNNENYDSWEFGTVWVADEHHDGYPYLVAMQGMQAYLTYMGNDSNVGSGLYASNPYRLGSSVSIEDLDWTRTGYVFQGWNTKADGTGQQYVIGQTEALSENLLLYGIWTHAVGVFEDGNGTLGNPYQIATAEQLNQIRNYPISHFILMRDIDLSTHASTIEWEPIPDFSGSLDGNNKIITNLNIDKGLANNVGLFAKLSGGHIENLVIDAVEVKGYENVGILVGHSEGSVVINNVKVSGAVYGDNHVGGLIGRSDNSNISNSMAEVEITAQSNIGGLVGTAMNSTISYSSAMGDVSGSGNIGGLVGYISDGAVTKSYATGAIEGIKSTGGLVGRFEHGTVTESYATGNVMGENDAGGLIGNFDRGEMTLSFATGNVQGCDDVGGLVSDNEGKISNSYATGNVTGWCNSGPNDSDTIGGLVGDNVSGEIVNSYSIGEVTGGIYVGGLVGYNGSGTITSSYYDKDLSGHSDDKGQGLTSEQMKNKDNYDGWVWDTIWVVDQHHDEYPHLIDMQAFVTYMGNDSNDGSGMYVSKFYRVGSSVTIEDLHWTRAEYLFQGWNTQSDGSGTSYEVGSTIQLNSDLLLYANWHPILSNNANLASLKIFADGEELALSSAFAAEEISYQAETTSSEVAIRATPSDAGATVTLEGEGLDGEKTVVLVEGDNVFEIVVKAEDATIKTYHLTIHRAVESEDVPSTPENWNQASQSNNENLAQLTVTIEGEELALSPAFAAEETSYRAETMSSEAMIEATPSHVLATVTLDGEGLNGEKTVVLVEGDNVFEIVVKAESGALKTYSLTIHRVVESEDAPTTPEAPECTFSDVTGHWAEVFICEAFERGIINGHTKTRFSPQTSITRVEFVAILFRTLGMTSSASSLIEHGFVDKDQIPAWASSMVHIAVENGIIQGYPDLSLRPLDNVSRAEMVTMMGRAMKWESLQGNTTFHDDADIPHWAKGYIQEAVARGLVIGRGDNRFSSSESATRAEATVLLLRLWHALDELNSKYSD